ncbi:zinc-dependent metalloprotease [Marivirga atlantica]
MDFYFDADKGKLYLAIDRLNEEMIYVNYLSAGIGSNDIGLDRGKIGDSKIIKFKKIGNKVLMFQPNYSYRASTENEMERQAVEEAFAQSIIYGFEVVAEEDWSVLVDATDFFMNDAYGVGEILKRQKEGSYSFDKSRSAFNSEGSRNFPENTEIDCWITLKGQASGREIRSVTPDAGYVTVRQHHSFVQLPDEDYKPRRFDVRAGYFQTSFQDYGVPIEDDITQRFITRHRLKKQNPEAESSEAVEPIIYYLDPGTPEPIKSALMEGAQWWNQAFEAAGYKNAFQMKILPEDADPLDIRYNVIQWVHRSTRGWSYGMSVVDPRTGEIIKGHVSLGSLRVRQDYLIATGLLSPFTDGKNSDPRMKELALARLRQLAAHEVGHTLGLAHNYIASTEGDASVMDYPHPNVKLNENGSIDISKAYDTGIGEWDKVAIRYGYSEHAEGETESLNDILEEAYDQGLRFISDRDARDPGGAHAQAHLWDNGQNAATQLNDLLEVRKVALNKMDASVIKTGEPLAKIQEALIPIYFMHRYQTEAAVKMIGGMDYNYKVKGDNQASMSILSPELQMQAVNSLIESVKPASLALPEDLLAAVHPRPIGYYNGRELLNGRTSITFDALGASEQLAAFTFDLFLHSARLARLVEFNSRDAQYPGVSAVLNSFKQEIFNSENLSDYHLAIQQSVQFVYVQSLMKSALNKSNSPLVLSAIHEHIKDIKKDMSGTNNWRSNQEKAFADFLVNQIEEFFDNPKEYTVKTPYELPPGSPIGCY